MTSSSDPDLNEPNTLQELIGSQSRNTSAGRRHTAAADTQQDTADTHSALTNTTAHRDNHMVAEPGVSTTTAEAVPVPGDSVHALDQWGVPRQIQAQGADAVLDYLDSQSRHRRRNNRRRSKPPPRRLLSRLVLHHRLLCSRSAWHRWTCLQGWAGRTSGPLQQLMRR